MTPSGKSGERRYGKWSGNPLGEPEDDRLCAEQVNNHERGWIPKQCRKPRGHGPNNEYCRQHAKRYKDEDLSVAQSGQST